MSEWDKDNYQEQEEEFELRERKRWLFFGLPFTFTTYRLTNKKLTVVSGLLTTVEDDILLYRIMDTSLRRSLFQKLFGLGCIRVASSDHSLPEMEIHNIRNAKEFKDALDAQIEHERDAGCGSVPANTWVAIWTGGWCTGYAGLLISPLRFCLSSFFALRK